MFKAKPIQTSQMRKEKKLDEEHWKLQKSFEESEERKKAEELERIQRNEELKRQRKEEQKRKMEEKEREAQLQKIQEEENKKKEAEIRRMEDLKRREKIKREQEKRLEMEKMKNMQPDQLQRAPRILRKESFKAINETNKIRGGMEPASVKTGHVNDKRNFWMRSTENLNARHEMSPGPRRRRLGGHDWMRSENTPEPMSRPGSSLGQAMAGSGTNVKHTAANWSTLSKSKSSAAVLLQQDPSNQLPPPRPRSRNDQSIKNATSHWNRDETGLSQDRRAFEEAKTHQVESTLSEWGKQESFQQSGRNTPNPTRTISEKFADSKIGNETWKTNIEHKEEAVAEVNNTSTSGGRARHKSGASPWRTKTPEPGLKILNVSVESPHGTNVHISQNAEAQMASFSQSQQLNEQDIRQQQVLQQEATSTSHHQHAEIKKTSSTKMTSSSSNIVSSSSSNMVESKSYKMQKMHQQQHQEATKQSEQQTLNIQQQKQLEELEKMKSEELHKKQ